MRAVRTVTPRSRASARHGATLAWWSSSVTMISSPGPHERPSALATWNVSVVMFAPNAISSADAPSSAASHSRALRERGVGLFAGRIAPMRVRVMVEQVVGDRVGNHARHLRAAGTVEIRDRCAALSPLECRKGGTDSLHVLYGSRGQRMEMGHGIASSSAQQFRGREAPARLYHAGGATPACVRHRGVRDRCRRSARAGIGTGAVLSEAMV